MPTRQLSLLPVAIGAVAARPTRFSQWYRAWAGPGPCV